MASIYLRDKTWWVSYRPRTTGPFIDHSRPGIGLMLNITNLGSNSNSPTASRFLIADPSGLFSSLLARRSFASSPTIKTKV